MKLQDKLNRIGNLLRKLQMLERPFADAIRDFSHTNAALDQVRLAKHDDRRAVREVESATAVLLEEIETPIPTEWDRTVAELAALGVERNFHSVGTARHLYADLMSYTTYLGLKVKCEREGKQFPDCWAEPLKFFAGQFTKVVGD